MNIVRKVFYNHIIRSALDVILSPLTLASCFWLKYLRRYWTYLPVSEGIYRFTGIFPIQDHYYEPLFNTKDNLRYSLRKDRNLPGINFNLDFQVALASNLKFTLELKDIPFSKPSETGFYFNNGSFTSGDAEFYYNIIRHFKPKRIIEIGSGSSTLLANIAIQKNLSEDVQFKTVLSCIEPYEQPWLESIGVNVIRQKVENISIEYFKELQANDILFIDSSHMVRPQGDVLFEFLEILPSLNKGVLVHIHDIFSPRDYLDQWVLKDHRFWNEQYLFEAFISGNQNFKIIGALNFLRHHEEKLFADRFLVKKDATGIEPASMWLIKE